MRTVYWCDHFRRYVNACTCHEPTPVTRVERLVAAIAAILLWRSP